MKSLLSYLVGLFLRLRECISRIKDSRIGVVFAYCFPCLFLVVSCLCFDYALTLPQVHEHDVRQALVDNAGHGCIASISWWILVGKRTLRDKLEVLCCGILSSAVDVDHFISAGSVELQVGYCAPHWGPFELIITGHAAQVTQARYVTKSLAESFV